MDKNETKTTVQPVLRQNSARFEDGVILMRVSDGQWQFHDRPFGVKVHSLDWYKRHLAEASQRALFLGDVMMSKASGGQWQQSDTFPYAVDIKPYVEVLEK